jgi:hypothetical protein
VQVFDQDGGFLRTWACRAPGPDSSSIPAGITIGAEGHVFVAENNNHRVQEFTRDGAFVAAFGSFGTAPGQFDTPNFLGADTRGNVFVCDENNSRIEGIRRGRRLQDVVGRARLGAGRVSAFRTTSPSMPRATPTSPTPTTTASRSSRPTRLRPFQPRSAA